MFGVVYRPSNSEKDVEEQFSREDTERCKHYKGVIMGTCNYPNVDWHSGSLKGREEQKFLELGEFSTASYFQSNKD